MSQCGTGHGSVAGGLGDEPLEPATETAVVRAELLGTERDALAGTEHDVHPPRRTPLDARDLLGVEAELEDVRRLRVTRELRVDDLVRAVRLKLEEVGAAGPAGRIVEDGLVDHVDASPARIRRSASAASTGSTTCLPVARKRSEVRRLVLLALAPDQVGLRVHDLRPLRLAARDLELQRHEMLAVEEVVQVGRRERVAAHTRKAQATAET